MNKLDNIRGKASSKTERILQFLISKPDEVFKPKDISDALDINLQTTVTVLTRLTLEGSIIKIGRGRYCYVDGGTMGAERAEDVDRDPSSKEWMNPEIASQVYEAIYELIGEVVGTAVIEDLTGLRSGDFNEQNPLKSLKELIDTLSKVLGRELTSDVVKIALAEKGQGFELKDIFGGDIPPD